MSAIYDDRTIDRFFAKVEKSADPDGCWLWKAKKRSDNGVFYLNGRFVDAHRFSYSLHLADLHENELVHRRCKDSACVNPAHLYTATDPKGRSDAERFWEKVDKSGDCWLWTGKKDRREVCGYGLFRQNAKWVRPHRFAYEQEHGSITDGMVIAHRCDNPLCVRIDHLFLATQKENVQDMFAKGRDNHVKGERVNTAKLTAEQVIEIRRLHKLGETASSLARRYGVASTAVDAIVHRRSWKHIA